MLEADPVRVVRCSKCGAEVDPRVSRYLFFRLGWRGRGRAPGQDVRPAPAREPGRDRSRAYCGPCADRLLEAIRDAFLRLPDFGPDGLEMVRAEFEERGVVCD